MAEPGNVWKEAIERQAEIDALLATPGVDLEEVRRRLFAITPSVPQPKPGPLQHLAQPHRKDPPSPRRIGLWPTLEEQVLEALPVIITQRKTDRARIRMVAERFDIQERDAKRLFHSAIEQLKHEMQYEFYRGNKTYFDYEHTPEYYAHCRWFLRTLDEINKRQDEEAEQKIDAGQDHIIAIESHEDLKQYLENQGSRGWYSGPMSHAAELWLTEHDARILWVNKRLKLIRGHEATLFDHKFITMVELGIKRDDIVPRHTCSQCDAVLDYNVIGFNRKLGYPDDGMLCLSCMGVDREYMESVANHYRVTGCNMFI